MLYRYWICVAAALLTACASSASAAAPEPTVRVQRTDLSWTGSIVLDTVRGGYLVFHEDDELDSIDVAEVNVLRRPRTSHLLGGAIGVLGGAAGGIALGLGTLLTGWIGFRSDSYDLAIGIFALSTATGAILGAALGVPVHPTDDLNLDGLDDDQRSAALQAFILDEHMRGIEP